jgi:hypothetical protein
MVNLWAWIPRSTLERGRRIEQKGGRQMSRRTWLFGPALIVCVVLLGCGKLSQEEMRQTIEVEVRLTELAKQP